MNDHLGSTRQVVDDAGLSVQQLSYVPYGDFKLSSGNKTRYDFTGKERDEMSAIDYFGARYYDCKIGRFLSVDPLAIKFKRWSPYAYSFDDPMRFVDPTGAAGEESHGWFTQIWDAAKAVFGGSTSKQAEHQQEAEQSGPLTVEDQKTVGGIKEVGLTAKNNAHDATESFANGTQKLAGAVQTAGLGAAVTGMTIPIAAPVMEPVAGGLLSISAGLDVISVAARGVDAAAFGGSKEAFFTQGLQAVVDYSAGKLAEGAFGMVLRETGLSAAFRSASTGEFVTNAAGYSMKATADASGVLLGDTLNKAGD